MKKKSYIIQYLIKYSNADEKIIRKALADFWKRFPEKGVNGNCGYIISSQWSHMNPVEVASNLMKDVLNGGKEYNPPFTERYWVVMTEKIKLKPLK